MSDRVASDHDEPLVIVATASNEITAQMWVEYLSNEEIPCFARSRGPGMGAFASVVLFEHDLLVTRKHAQAARLLLRQYANGQDLELVP